MTDFVVGVTLNADGAQFSNTMEGAAGAVENVGASAKDATGAAAGLTAATAGAEAATTGLGGAARKTAADLEAEAAAARDQGAAARAAAQADEVLSQAKRKVQQESGRTRAGMAQLGQQLSDVQVQLLAGTNAFTILGQQAGQVAYAMSQMEGKAASVGTFLAGPWGAAIIGGVSLLGLLITKTLGAADADDQHAAAAKSNEEAIRELNVQLGKQIQTEEQARLATLNSANALLAKEVATRRATQAAIDAAIQRRKDALEQTDIQPEGGLNFGITGAAMQDADIRSLTAERAKQDTAIAEAAKGVRMAAIPIMQANAAANIDAAAGATKRYNSEVAKLNAQFADPHSQMTRQQYEADFGRLKAAHEAELDALNKNNEGRARHTRGLSDAEKAAREAAAADRELNQTLDQIQAKFDPATKAARDYATSLSDIARLQAGGKITSGQAFDYSMRASAAATEANQKSQHDQFVKMFGDPDKELNAIVDSISGKMDTGMVKAARDFRREGEQAATAIADLLGGKVGGIVKTIIQLLNNPLLNPGGARTGSGPLGMSGGGGLQSFLFGSSPSPQAQREYYAAHPDAAAGSMPGSGGFIGGAQDFFGKFEKSIDKTFSGIFGEHGVFPESLSSTLGKAFGGAQVGGAVGKGVTDLLGVKGSSTGAQLGGALGSLVGGPIGSIIGGIAGSVIGGLFKSAPRANSGAITSVNSTAAAFGNNAQSKAAVDSATTTIQDGLQQIADALGATIGNFSVSIGKYKDNYRVSASGTGAVGSKSFKNSPDLAYNGQDAAAAVSAAIANAIADGAIAGIDSKVQQALQSSPNLDRALKEALGVQAVEDILSGVSSDFAKELRSFEQTAKERVRIAQQYGFDVVAIEKRNADDRKALLDQELASRVGSIQSFAKSLTSGDLFEGTQVDKRNALFGQLAGAQADVAAGKAGAADNLANLLQNFVQTSRTAYGTAGSEYAADRQKALDIAQATIDAAQKQIADAAAAAAQTNSHLETANQLASENNDQNAQMIALLQGMGAGSLAGLVLGSTGSRQFNPSIAKV